MYQHITYFSQVPELVCHYIDTIFKFNYKIEFKAAINILILAMNQKLMCNMKQVTHNDKITENLLTLQFPLALWSILASFKNFTLTALHVYRFQMKTGSCFQKKKLSTDKISNYLLNVVKD